MATDPTSLDLLAARRVLERRNAAPPSDPALGVAVVGALDSNPDEVAAARALARRSGMPLPLAQQDPKEAERAARIRELNLPGMEERSPGVARALLNPDLAQVAHDDVEKMWAIERYVRDIGQRFERGQAVNELGQLGFDALIGDDDPAREYRIRQLNAQQQNEVDYGVDPGGAAGFLVGIPGAAAESLPMLASGVKESVKFGVAGAAGGAAIGAGMGLTGGPAAPATVPAGAAAGALTGYGYGATVGLFVSSAKMEAGHSYLELRDMTDDQGQPIDRRLAGGLSLAVGIAAGGVETWGLGKLFAKIPGADKLTGAGMREAARQAVANPAFRRFASQLAGTMTESAVTEGATEGLQKLIAIGGELTAGLATGKGLQDFTFEAPGPDGQTIVLKGTDAILAHVLSSAAQGAQMGAGIAGAGQTARLVTDSERARAAVAKLPGIERLTRSAQESKLRERDPEAFKAIVKQVAEEAQVDSVYVAPEAMRTYFESISPEEAQALAADIPAIGQQQEEVARTGADVRLSLEDWLAHPEMAEALRDHVRFDPLEMTHKEALGWQEDLERQVGDLQDVVEGAKTEKDALALVGEHMRAELLKVYPETVVGPMTEFIVDRYRTRAQRLGVPVAELIQQEGLPRIEGPHQGADQKGALPPTLEDKLGTIRDEESVRRVLGDMRAKRLPKLTRGTPIVDLLRTRGGVRPDSVLAGELENMGFKRSGKGSFAGLITAKGTLDKFSGRRREPLGDLDNLVADEHPELAAVVGTDETGQYLSRQGLLDELARELRGESRVVDPMEEQALRAAQEEQAAVQAVLDEMGVPLDQADDAVVAKLTQRFSSREFQQRVAETHEEAARTPEFKAWAGDAEVVLDPESHTFTEGQPVVVATFHGTTHDFDTIDTDIAAIESDLGRAFYSSTSRGDVDRNYAGIGPDLTGRLERETEYLESVIPDDPTAYGLPEDADGVAIRSRAEALAREKLVGKAGEQGKVIPVFVKLEKPALFGYDRKSTSLIDLEGDYDEESEEFSDSENLLTIIDAAREAESNYLDFDADAFLGRLEEYRDRGAISAKQLVETVTSENYATTLDGSSLASNQIAQDILRALGFDGAIVIDAQERFRGMDIGENVQHVVVFEPNGKNVKAAQSKAFNPQRDSIYEQPAYHGSHARFNRFGLEFIGTGEGAQAFGWGLYFSSEKGVADFYEQEVSYRKLVDAFRQEMPDDADFEEALAAADSMSPEHARVIRALAADDWLGFDHPAQAITAAFKELKNYDASQELRDAVKAARGQVYEVEVPDDENLLDWDKPMAKQHPNVLRILKESGLLREFKENKSDFSSPMRTRGDRGEHFYEWLAWRERDQTPENTVGIAGWTSVTQTMNDTVQKPEAASRILAGLGILGHRYKAGQIAGVKSGATNFVIYDDKAIQIARTFYEGATATDGGPTTRGSIRMTDDLTEVIIRFTEAQDLSTFLHESGHLFLAQLEKDAARDEGQLDADLATVKNWARAQVGTDDLTSDAVQELWARSFEAYLMEGKAPSLSLERAFARFASWLVRIYKRLRGIPGYRDNLTPEIRGVMDRLLATDEQIAEAAEARGLAELDAQALGMTEEQAAKYREQVADGMGEAKRALQVQLMAQLERQKTREWKALREEVRKEIEADVNSRPVFQAAHWLAKGEALEGQPAPALPEGKLDAEALVELYGKEIKKALPKRLWSKEGLHPDLVAEAFGFPDGDALVRALEAAGNRADVIEAETDALMEKRHGTLQTSAQLEDAAVEALANAKQLRALKTAERAIAAKAGGKVIPIAITRATAQRLVRSTRYRDLTPARYRAAALKASRDVVRMIAKGEFPEAQTAIRQQILNLVMEAEARNAMTEADKAVDYLNRVQKRKSRERIGKAGADYLEQIDGMLERFDLRQHQSLRKIDRTTALAQWIAEQEAAGEEVIIPPKLRNEAFKQSWKELSIDDVLALRDAVKNVEHLARRKNEFLANRERRQREAVQTELVAAAAANLPGRRVPNDMTPGKVEQLRRTLLSAEGSLVKMEFLIDLLDGGDPMGPWRANVFTPIAEAQAERYDLSGEYTHRLGELMAELVKGREALFARKWAAPQTGNRVTMWNVIGIALNVGNEGNYRNLVEGNRLSEGAIKSLLDEHMTEADWTFVRETWKLIDSLWPRIAEQERRLTGVVPEKVTGRTVSTPFGEFEGGYFPIVRDPDKSEAARRNADKGLYDGIETAFQRAITGHGFTIERTGATGPLLLDLAVIPAHLDAVIHDLTHRDVLMQIDKLLAGKPIVDIFGESGRAELYRLFRPWLQGIAKDRIVENRALAGMAGLLRVLRANTSSFALGFRATTLAMQVSGHSNAYGLLREKLPNAGRWIGVGIKKAFAGGRINGMREHFANVLEVSGEMRHRIGNIDRDLRDVIRRNQGENTIPARVRTAAMELIGQMQMFAVDLPVWSGAYEGAVRELGYSHEDAVTFADSIIRMSQGAAGAKDLSAIQRADEGYKQFLTFFSYRNLVYNQIVSAGRRVRAPRDVGRFLATWAFSITIPFVYAALVRQAITGHGGLPGDDDDGPGDWIAWFIASNLAEFVGTAPYVADLAGVARAATGEGRFFMSATPTQRVAEAVGDLVVPKDVTDVTFDALRVSAMLTGMPADWALKLSEDAIRESD